MARGGGEEERRKVGVQYTMCLKNRMLIGSGIEEVNCVPMKNQEMRGDSYCLIGVKCAPMHEVLSKLIVVCLF